MVGQHGGELGLVGEQGIEVCLGNLGEGGVGRREHGERARALERVDQAGGLECGGKGIERAGGYGGIDDVLGLHREGGTQGNGGGDEGLLHVVLQKGLVVFTMSRQKCGADRIYTKQYSL